MAEKRVSAKNKYEKVAKSFAVGLLARYIRLVDRTSKRNKEFHLLEQSFDDNAPVIIAGWHGTFLLAPILMPRPKEVSAVVARHGDAEFMGQLLQRFDVNLIRGAGAGGRKKDKGGVAALRMSLRELKAGRSIALTADVPPGPARKASLGLITIARLSGRPILPVAAVTSRFRVLNTWSRFVVNLPFSKLALIAGEPVFVPRDASEQVMEDRRILLEQRINELVEHGHELVGADPALSAAPTVGQPPQPGLALKAYAFGMKAARPLARPILKRRARRGKEDLSRLGERFGRAGAGRPTGPLMWIHAASVGETNAVLPLIEALIANERDLSVLLTSGTVTSAKIAVARLPSGAVHQFVPLDSPIYVKRFFDHWRPDLAMFVESEIWPNLMLETANRKIPLLLANGIMSVKSYRNWRKNPGLARPLFGCFHLALVQNVAMQGRFLRLGTPQIEVTGNLKFDAPQLPVDENQFQAVKAMIGTRPVFLAASTHEGEEQQIIEAHQKLLDHSPDLLTIIVPRHPLRGAEVAALVSKAGIEGAQRSTKEAVSSKTGIYIADTLGEIGLFYRASKITFMGGSLVDVGGHNPIEAIKFNTAVLTGPSWHNQGDSFSALLKRGGALEVNSADELATQVAVLLSDDLSLQRLIKKGEEVAGELAGALDRSMKALAPFIEQVRARYDDMEGV